MNKLQAAWAAIPVYIRSVLNVGIVGSVVVLTGAVITAQGVIGVDWALTGQRALDAFGLGIAVAIVRLINPLETQYGGIGAAKVDNPDVPLDSLSDIDSSDGSEVALDPTQADVALPAADPVPADPAAGA